MDPWLKVVLGLALLAGVFAAYWGGLRLWLWWEERLNRRGRS